MPSCPRSRGLGNLFRRRHTSRELRRHTRYTNGEPPPNRFNFRLRGFLLPVDSQSPTAPPPWLIGMGTLTFGFVAGFIVTALPFLLARAGVSVDRIATVSATAMSPTFWAFLVTPLVDVGFTRRFYAFAFATAAAVNLAAALWFFSPEHLSLFTALLLVAQLAVV